MDKTYALLLSFLLTCLLASTFYALSLSTNEKQTFILARVIDGDTIELDNGETLRLLNINTPEKNMPYTGLSKSFLQEYQNSSIYVERTEYDKYKRTLARIYSLDGDYLNLELVKRGLSSKFLVADEEQQLFADAEREAIEDNKGIWNKSQYYGCFDIDINKKMEVVTIKNVCNKQINMLDWQIKDESRKVYTFPSIVITQISLHSAVGKDNASDLFWNLKDSVWNDDADSLYLLDNNWRIVHYETYH